MRYDFEKPDEGFPEPDNRWLWRLLIILLPLIIGPCVKLNCQDITVGCPNTCIDNGMSWDGTAKREGMFGVRCGCKKLPRPPRQLWMP